MTNPPGVVLAAVGEVLDNKTSFYLLNHPSLTWVATNNTDMMTLPNTLKLNAGGSWPYFYGRVMYNGSYRVGKLHAGGGAFGFWVWIEPVQFSSTSGFEVLTCATNLICEFLKDSSSFF